jgi:hypothetical protein
MEAILLPKKEHQSRHDEGVQHRRRNRQILGQMESKRPSLQLDPEEIITRKHAESISVAFQTPERVPQGYQR